MELLVVLAFEDRLFASSNIHFRIKRVCDRFDDALLPDRVRSVDSSRVENSCSLKKNIRTNPTTTSTRARGFVFFTPFVTLASSSSFLADGRSQPESPSCLAGIVSRRTASLSRSDSTLTVPPPNTCCFANAAHASMTCFCGGKQYCSIAI